MKLSELLEELTDILESHGDVDVLIETPEFDLYGEHVNNVETDITNIETLDSPFRILLT